VGAPASLRFRFSAPRGIFCCVRRPPHGMLIAGGKTALYALQVTRLGTSAAAAMI
jgi:hypothetical protein